MRTTSFPVASLVNSETDAEVRSPAVILTPDFAHHDWRPLADAALSDCEVRVVWPDGMTHTCHPLWLFEQTVGVEPLTREGSVDPGELPSSSALVAADVASDGSLELTWEDGTTSLAHPGWLRSIAEGRHLPRAAIGEPVEWTTATMADLPTFDGSAVLDDDSVFAAWLSSLCIVGVGRLRGAPVTDGFMADLAARIGPIRGSNFGGVFTVESIVHPDSTANTGMALGQHTDLPTRETPPGFQFLHCVENSVLGGQSRMADGMAVVAEIRRRHPGAYESLTTDEWVFANRAVDATTAGSGRSSTSTDPVRRSRSERSPPCVSARTGRSIGNNRHTTRCVSSRRSLTIPAS
jgi:gamma-butyrobetaine dioxygenase